MDLNVIPLNNDNGYSIKDMVKIFNVSITTIRNWEKLGYIHPQVNQKNHYRKYSLKDIHNVINADLINIDRKHQMKNNLLNFTKKDLVIIKSYLQEQNYQLVPSIFLEWLSLLRQANPSLIYIVNSRLLSYENKILISSRNVSQYIFYIVKHFTSCNDNLNTTNNKQITIDAINSMTTTSTNQMISHLRNFVVYQNCNNNQYHEDDLVHVLCANKNNDNAMLNYFINDKTQLVVETMYHFMMISWLYFNNITDVNEIKKINLDNYCWQQTNKGSKQNE